MVGLIDEIFIVARRDAIDEHVQTCKSGPKIT